MAVTSNLRVEISLAGDISAQASPFAAENTASPGVFEIRDLSNGFTAIDIPTGSTSVTILPPSTNTTSIIIKGVTGDTGFRLHNTNPSVIGINSASDSLGITVGAAITSCRFYWT